jgi:hypothetical protein
LFREVCAQTVHKRRGETARRELTNRLENPTQTSERLSVGEAARLIAARWSLHVDPRTVRRWIVRGELGDALTAPGSSPSSREQRSASCAPRPTPGSSATPSLSAVK